VSPADLDLPSDPDELRAFAEVIKARLAASEQALAQEQKALAYDLLAISAKLAETPCSPLYKGPVSPDKALHELVKAGAQT